MLIYKIIVSLLLYICYWRGLKGRIPVVDIQKYRQTNKQTDRRSLGPTPRIDEQTDRFAIARTNIALLGNRQKSFQLVDPFSTIMVIVLDDRSQIQVHTNERSHIHRKTRRHM